MILLNGQWQGGADKITLESLNEIKKLYLSQNSYKEVQIDEQDTLEDENGILGLSIIKQQTDQALNILKTEKPQKLFTVGGGCDADIASIAYLNKAYQGDMTVLWFDAHGDVNSPDESKTHLFYGMPVRVLLGGCNKKFNDIIDFPLKSSQIIHIGGRAFDDAEIDFMKNNRIAFITDYYDDFTGSVIKTLKMTNKRHCYIHLDLDVLNPVTFPYVPVPELGGISFEMLKETLGVIKNEFNIVGYGLYEYAPQKKFISEMNWFVNYGKEISE